MQKVITSIPLLGFILISILLMLNKVKKAEDLAILVFIFLVIALTYRYLHEKN